MTLSIFWGLFFLFLFLLGLYLMVVLPIAKKYNSTQYLDLGLGAFLIVLALGYVTFAHVIPIYNRDDTIQACSSKSPQAICYGLDEETCSKAWNSFSEACEAEVAPIRAKRPAALLHPIVFRCQARKFDKISFYNRRRTDSLFCREYFAKIDE